MHLKDLLHNLSPHEIPEAFRDLEIPFISSDSRNVKEGCIFVALKGAGGHGEHFVDEAISKGAKVIVREEKNSPLENTASPPNSVPMTRSSIPDQSPMRDGQGPCILTVPDARQFLTELLLRFYGNVSQKIKVIGITGTNGKTTVTYLCESIFGCAGKVCGVIGTVRHRFGRKEFEAKNTTPGLIDNHEFLSAMTRENIDYCVMEVSSHALVQRRVDGIDFRTAVFTNLSRDHLDYHKDEEEYFQAKAQLFTRLSQNSTAVINIDDAYTDKLLKLTITPVKTYGINKPADVMARDIQLRLSGTTFTLASPSGDVMLQTRLIGVHNIENILAAAGVCLQEGIPLEKIKQGIEQVTTIPGRLERIQEGQDFYVFVDYAHTDDALRKVLSNIKSISSAKIILVFGCGGDRDKGKRPKMGKVAGMLADEVILTNDNPRGEAPQEIIDQVIGGFEKQNYTVILDREEAIRKALEQAKAGEIILIAGKGHEDYQIFKDKTIPFDDRKVVRKYLLGGRVKGIKD